MPAGKRQRGRADRGDDDAHFGDRLEEANSFDNHHDSFR